MKWKTGISANLKNLQWALDFVLVDVINYCNKKVLP